MTEPLPRDLLPGTLDMVILRTLHEQPLHGYAFNQMVKAIQLGMAAR